jgi:hypothetical protein
VIGLARTFGRYGYKRRQSEDYACEAIARLLILAGYDPAAPAGELRVLAESPLPAAWRPALVRRNQHELHLANGSVFRALTTTRPIGRGLAAYWGLADEFASDPGRQSSWRPWSRAVRACTS